MLDDPLYLPLLKNLSYHNLDEMGTQVDQKNVINNGLHAMGWKVMTWADSHGQPLNRGRDKHRDRSFMDEEDSMRWDGKRKDLFLFVTMEHHSCLFFLVKVSIFDVFANIENVSNSYLNLVFSSMTC